MKWETFQSEAHKISYGEVWLSRLSRYQKVTNNCSENFHTAKSSTIPFSSKMLTSQKHS